MSKKINCEYFLPYSKACSAPTENESPPGICIECVKPSNPDECPVKKYYADPGPYVNEENITLESFIQKCGVK